MEDCLYLVPWVIGSVRDSLAWPGDQSSAHGPETASSWRKLLHNIPCVISGKLLTQSWMWLAFLSLRLMCCIWGRPEKNSRSFLSLFSITWSFFGIQELSWRQPPCREVMWCAWHQSVPFPKLVYCVMESDLILISLKHLSPLAPLLCTLPYFILVWLCGWQWVHVCILCMLRKCLQYWVPWSTFPWRCGKGPVVINFFSY